MSHGEPAPGHIGDMCRIHSYSEGLVCSVCYKEKMDKLDKAITLLKCVKGLIGGLVGSKFMKRIDDLIK